MFIIVPMNVKQRIEARLAVVDSKKVDLAEYVGVQAQYVNNWMVRDSLPKKHLFKAAAFLRCSTEWLATGKGDPDEGVSQIGANLPAYVLAISERISELSAADQLLITSMLDHMGKQTNGGSPEFYEKHTTHAAPPNTEQAIKDGYSPDEWEIKDEKEG